VARKGYKRGGGGGDAPTALPPEVGLCPGALAMENREVVTATLSAPDHRRQPAPPPPPPLPGMPHVYYCWRSCSIYFVYSSVASRC